MNTTTEKMFYIGRKACGCIGGFIVDQPECPDRTERWVADFVRSGLTVERITATAARGLTMRCDCASKREPAWAERDGADGKL